MLQWGNTERSSALHLLEGTGSVILMSSSSCNCASDPEMEEALGSLESTDAKRCWKDDKEKQLLEISFTWGRNFK